MKKVKTKIVALFAFIFIASYVPESYPTAFGDWKCKGSGKELETNGSIIHYKNCDYLAYHNAKWHWGFRHYLWLTLGLTLTGLSIYQIVEEYDNK
jgi:hypothetical protein